MTTMKKIKTVVTVSLMTIAFSLAPLSIQAHGEEHTEQLEFEPMENDFGSYEPNMEITRTIDIVMSDQMRFTPDAVEVKKGDVIKFVHTNTGKIKHEFVLGTPDVLSKHYEMMKKFPTMKHSQPYMLHVSPGKKGAIVWKFSKAGEFAFGCLIPGHYEAGMKGTVKVGS